MASRQQWPDSSIYIIIHLFPGLDRSAILTPSGPEHGAEDI
jgi:hypothetical protein